MTKLSQSEQQMVNKIIDAGKQLGVPDVMIQAALNIANAESSFLPTASARTNSAKGMFQYLDSTWKSRLLVKARQSPLVLTLNHAKDWISLLISPSA